MILRNSGKNIGKFESIIGSGLITFYILRVIRSTMLIDL